MDNQVSVDLQEVLRITQIRLREVTEQAILLEALVNQQKLELDQLRSVVDEVGREIEDGSKVQQA